MRPVLQDKGISALAISESVICKYYIEIERRKSILGRLRDKIDSIQSLKAMEVGITFGEEKESQFKAPLHLHETHANAWVKCFNNYYPKNGFYRIWDFPPVNLTEKMMEELIKVSQAISRRIARSSQAFWMRGA